MTKGRYLLSRGSPLMALEQNRTHVCAATTQARDTARVEKGESCGAVSALFTLGDIFFFFFGFAAAVEFMSFRHRIIF